MRDYIKSYHVFMSTGWVKMLSYFLYPILVTGVIGVLAGLFEMIEDIGFPNGLIYLQTTIWIVGAEALHALLVWGSIATRDTNKLEYLKTSARGRDVLRKGLYADVVRRWITIILLILVAYIPCRTTVSLPTMLGILFFTIGFAEAMQMLIRKINMVQVLILMLTVGSVGAAQTVVIFALLVHSFPWWLVWLPMGMAVVICVLNIKMVMKRERESYFDEGVV